MSYTARKSLSNLLNSKWYKYAVGRCGIAMPNCFTYATARISEILGKNQPLDDVRVVGAQDLWDNYADGYTRSNYAKEGALMIWSYGQYGHVAVCEELIDTNTIAWSQSNYGGSMFDY
ncbi:MAG: CHAP domain-containing protein, partial [Longicatena sp.]